MVFLSTGRLNFSKSRADNTVFLIFNWFQNFVSSARDFKKKRFRKLGENAIFQFFIFKCFYIQSSFLRSFSCFFQFLNSLSTHINLRLQIPTSNLVTLSPAITLFKLHSFYSNKSELQKDHFKSKTNSYYSLLGNADDQSNFQTSTGSENQILKPTIQQILKTNNSTHSMHSTVVNGKI